MKKLLILAAAAALLLASCAKVEPTTKTVVDENVPIAFSNYAPRSITKAGDTYVSGNTLVNGKHFAVYAWNTAYGAFLGVDPGTPAFMNPADVTYAGDTSTGELNTYSPVRFWPAGDQPENLSFVAYYPYGGAGITAPTFTTGVGTYAFTAQAAAADMVDFCVADVVNDQVYGQTNDSANGHKSTVKFTFKHQLTKVQFKFKKVTGLGGTTVIELVDAKLAGIKNSGTLTATYAKNASPAVNALGTTSTEWSAQAGTAGYDVFVNGNNPETTAPVVLTESFSSVADADIFLMVPQDMAPTTQVLNLTWKVKVYDTAAHATANGSEGLVNETTNTKSLSFYSDLVTSDTDDTSVSPINWVKNYFVTYNITIGPKPIWFTATVADWATEQNGYFNVQ